MTPPDKPDAQRSASPDTPDGLGDPDDATPDWRGPEHRVRPPFSWGGLGLMIVGGIVAGVGFAIISTPWIVGGLIVVVLGAASALYGGLFYDIEGHGASLDDEKRVVPGATATAKDPELRHDVEQEEDELSTIRDRPGVRPGLQKPAAWLLLIIAAWLICSQGVFYERTPVGRIGTLRAGGAGLLIALPALYLALVRGSRVAAGLCALAGVGLILGGLLAAHDQTRSMVNEILCGVLVLALVPLAARLPRRDLSGGARQASSR